MGDRAKKDKAYGKPLDYNIPQNFEPRPYQRDVLKALDNGIRKVFMRWHRRAGKDRVAFAHIIRKMWERPGVYYYFFPEYSQGRKVIWEEKAFLDMIPPHLIKTMRRNEMVMEWHNGSIFRVVGTDNIDSIMGTNPVGCVFSEYSLQDPRAWSFISPILAENNGWAIIQGTPRGHNHMFELEEYAKSSSDWFVSVKTVKDTGQDQEERIQKEMAEKLVLSGQDHVDQEYYVSYTAGIQGTYYSDHLKIARVHGRIGSFPPESHKWVDLFWDVGYKDPTAIWFRQLDGSKVTWINYMEWVQCDFPEIVAKLVETGYKIRRHYLPHDAGETSQQTGHCDARIISDLCKQANIGFRYTVLPKLRKQTGINYTRKRFSNYYFNDMEPGVQDGIKKLELYHKKYDVRRKTFQDEPVHDWTSHCADAFRLEGVCSQQEEENYMAQITNGAPIKTIRDTDAWD